MTTSEVWTIVQHSGYGYAQKPGFRQGLELRSVSTKAQKMRVLEAGGVLFKTYSEASNYCEKESYPSEVTGLYPQAPGKFSKRQVDQLAIYIPQNLETALSQGAITVI